MDNQQLSPEQGRVQRSSRKRVLDLNKYIVWETPCLINKIYVYTLSSTKDNKVRYVGITTDPLRRLSHHTSKSYYKNTYKSNWIRKELEKANQILMTIVDSYTDLEEALLKEEKLIATHKDLTNYVLLPTKPNVKKCYLYNIFTSEIIEFKSVLSAANYLRVTPSALYDSLILSKWLMSFNKDFDKLIKTKHRLKGKNLKTGEICYFLTQEHAAKYIGCSKQSVNSCIMGIRKSAKKWLLCKKDSEFPIYANSHISPVICVNDGQIYNSIKEAAAYYKLDESSIAKVCKGLRKHTGNKSFKYQEDMIQPL
jgi:predicted GIY-YIG superfamily endonuclease/DNA-binding XRE family transcriptional regulator